MIQKLYLNKYLLLFLTQVYFLFFNINSTKTIFSEISNLNAIYFTIHVLLSILLFLFSILFFKYEKGLIFGLFFISIFEFFIFYKQITKLLLSNFITLDNKYLIYCLFIILVFTIILLFIQKLSKYCTDIIKIVIMSLLMLNTIEIMKFCFFKSNLSTINSFKLKEDAPSIVLVIVDEMTSLDIINQKMKGNIHFNLKSFEEIKNTTSTHKETLFSINNLLNLGKSDFNLLQSPINLVTKNLRNNQLTNLFRDNHYQILNESIFEIQKTNSLKPENKSEFGFDFFDNTTLVYSSLYNNICVPYTMFKYKTLLSLGLDVDSARYRALKQDNIQLKNRLIQSFKDTNDRSFSYYHFTVPHDPYCFDSLGNIHYDVNKYFARQSKDYLNSAKFASGLVQNIIDSFDKSNAKMNTVIIIQGDHGSRITNLPMSENERLSILSLVYIPKKGKIKFKENPTHIDILKSILEYYKK